MSRLTSSPMTEVSRFRVVLDRIRVKNPRNPAYRHLPCMNVTICSTSRMSAFVLFRRCQWGSLPADGQTSEKENEA